MHPDPREWSIEDWDRVGWALEALFAFYVAFASPVGFLILMFAAFIALLYAGDYYNHL